MARVPCIRLFLVVVTLGAASPCVTEGSHAAPAARVTSTQGPQPLDWLKSGDYSALDSYYSQQQQAYEAGGIADEELYASFRKLYEDSPGNERFFTGWVEAYPGSYSAVLARGTYLYRMAWAVRGDNYISDIPASQIEAMKSLLARARLDLSASLTLTDKPYLSTLYLLNVAMLNGTVAERRQWFERGTSIDPNSSLVRVRYMFSLRPRWGGSYQEMRGFLKQCEQQSLPPRLLARLNILIHADLAEDAMRTADNQKIFDEWQQVIELASAAGEEPSTEALIGFTRAAQDLNRSMDAQRGLNLLEGRSPNDAWSQARLGWIYLQAHQDDKAWSFLTRAAGQNDPWAQFVLGHGIHDGIATLHKAPDQQAGLAWIRRSAEQCFPDAVRFLEARGEKPTQECKQRASGKREWWLVLLPALGALIPGLLAALARANRKRTVASIDHPDRMQYPPGTLALGLLSLGLVPALASLFMLHDNAAAAPIFGAVLPLLGVLGVSMLVAYGRVWHELTAEGLTFGRLLGRRGTLKWRDVTRITYSSRMRWFRIETASGEHVLISAMLTGLPQFARAVLREVPSYAIDDITRGVLQARAQGELPRLA
jgi:hypothetical protein